MTKPTNAGNTGKRKPRAKTRVVTKPADPRQLKFLEHYLDPDSLCYGNAYQAALRAGYSLNYAKHILNFSQNWLAETSRKQRGPSGDEIIDRLFDEAKAARASKDRIRALEILAKIQKLFTDGAVINNNLNVGITVTVNEMSEAQLDKVISTGFNIIRV